MRFSLRNAITLAVVCGLVITAILGLYVAASAETTWTITYLAPGDPGGFYGVGSYDFLSRPQYIPVYLQENGNWVFQGFYGQVALPSEMPPISFQGGSFDRAVAVPSQVVSVPELAIIPHLRLPRLIKTGLGIDAALTRGLQRITTRLASAILRAPHSGTDIYLDRFTVRVTEWCAGKQTLLLMLVAAGLIAAVLPLSAPWKFGLLLLAVPLAIEANTLRVVGIALGFQHLPYDTAYRWKGVIQVATNSVALGQLLWVARAGRSAA